MQPMRVFEQIKSNMLLIIHAPVNEATQNSSMALWHY
jgi:hypothetical protein